MATNKRDKNTTQNQPMTMISLRLPESTVNSLKKIAPKLGFAGYQPLIRTYITQGLEADWDRIADGTTINYLVESLKDKGVDENVLNNALAETRVAYEVNPMPTFIVGMSAADESSVAKNMGRNNPPICCSP